MPRGRPTPGGSGSRSSTRASPTSSSSSPSTRATSRRPPSARSTRARVPVIEDDGFALYETAAIVEYIEDKHPGEPRLFASDIRERALQRRGGGVAPCSAPSHWRAARRVGGARGARPHDPAEPPRPRRRGDRMRGLPFVFLLTMSISTASAAECPAASSGAVLSDLRDARSCRRAAQTYKSCTRATTQDVDFAEVVVGKCESGFLARLKPTQRASYRRQMSRCERKYARQTGTMDRSFEASCRVNVALRFARTASPRGL
jgi:hypothetical protein